MVWLNRRQWKSSRFLETRRNYAYFTERPQKIFRDADESYDSPQFLYLRVYFQDSVPRQEKGRFMYINYPQLSRIPTEGFDIS